uniref:Uncharacterized protein n=1 Tax=Rhodnius prolixus TaxID=13249 RepID=T1IDB9_RHOPR
MSQKQIESYLVQNSSSNSTPSRVRIPLKRSRSSPESLPSQSKKLITEEKSGEMSSSGNDELLISIGKIIDTKLAVLPTKDDFNLLREEMKSLKIENESLKVQIKSLKENERQLNKRLEMLENNSRKNNLIIKGLLFSDQDNLLDIVDDFFSNVMKIEDKVEIVEVRPLGNKNMKKSNLKSFIKVDKLIINDVICSWDDTMGLSYEEEFGAAKLKEIVGHDFSEFIHGLLQEPPRRRANLPTSPGRQQSSSRSNT